uniref:Uncharacterized protein n=1 Tax=Zooxanthella nutricula TaxID=1333877 RepID=A0A6U6UW61_9DINO|mmetsp:Transcript_86489/g.264660  ORF Transcript_86489/g.264660 Transcript_86489/m.264660 type:complete len:208 (+) Transcript_86489:55-678(+)
MGPVLTASFVSIAAGLAAISLARNPGVAPSQSGLAAAPEAGVVGAALAEAGAFASESTEKPEETDGAEGSISRVYSSLPVEKNHWFEPTLELGIEGTISKVHAGLPMAKNHWFEPPPKKTWADLFKARGDLIDKPNVVNKRGSSARRSSERNVHIKYGQIRRDQIEIRRGQIRGMEETIGYSFPPVPADQYNRRIKQSTVTSSWAAT